LQSRSETLAAKPRNGCGIAVWGLACVFPLWSHSGSAVAQVAGADSPGPAVPVKPTAPVTPPAHHGHHAQRPASLDDRVRMFAKNYDLDAAQQAAVKNILQQRQQETLQLRTDPSLSGEARIERFRALQTATVEQIRGVLTEEQRKKYNPLAPRELKPEPEQRSVEEWLKLTTPQ
jgi:Spy/CpxP family protein refolding chaperone